MKIKHLLMTLICLLLLSVSVFAQRLNYDSSFTPTLNGSVNFLEILSDGKILIAGDFTVVNGVARNKIALLNADGSLDMSFDVNWLAGPFGQPVNITSMEVLPDGKILVGGLIPFGGNSGNLRVRRINADGTPDGTLTSIPTMDGTIYKVDQLPNGKILVCGQFSMANNNPKPWLARYHNDGTYDATFTPTLNNQCRDLEVQPDGKYLIAGLYDTVNGSQRVGMTRFNTDDSIDTGFDTGSLSYLGMELLSDGTLIGFQRTSSSGQLVKRLNANGSVQLAYSASVAKGDIAFQSDGKLFVAGDFDSLVGINRYNTDGTHDPSLNRLMYIGSSSPYSPRAIAVTADGKVIAGGPFTQISISSSIWVNRTYLVRYVPEAIPIIPKFDFDGDGRDDIAVYRPSDTYWYLNQSAAGFFAAQFGLAQDKPIVADYDGDNKADIAVFRDGIWMWLRSTDFTFASRICGQAGDIPQPSVGNSSFYGNFLVFRPSDGKFYVQPVFQNATPADMRNLNPLPNDKPVVADYDGDGISDLAVYRNGQWRVLPTSTQSVRTFNFGLAGDKPVPADYDGDGRADYAVFRPSDGTWYIQKSTEGFYAVQWGLADDLPVPADYDGDGKTDIAVYRNGAWYQLRSGGSNHFEQFGLSTDIPAQMR